jgi:hypothetical protein
MRSMSRMTPTPADRRRRIARLLATVEVLETRALLADGITPAGGADLTAKAGVPLSGAVFATFTVSDPSALLGPANLERARIDFGDGSPPDKNVPATPTGNGFQFVDTHTYAAPGTYTVTVMIAFPGSHKPHDNTVTTQVTVAAPTPTASPLAATGQAIRVKAAHPFHKSVARFSEPGTTPGNFTVQIDWGDQTGLTSGQVRRQGRGRYAVLGTHSYLTPGVFQVMVMIHDSAGQEADTMSAATVKGKPLRAH